MKKNKILKFLYIWKQINNYDISIKKKQLKKFLYIWKKKIMTTINIFHNVATQDG